MAQGCLTEYGKATRHVAKEMSGEEKQEKKQRPVFPGNLGGGGSRQGFL